MATPDEPGAGLRAVMNQVPITMPATITTLHEMMTRFGPGLAGAEHISTAKFNEWMAHTAICIATIENRLERLEGRPGMPDDALGAILSEFYDPSSQ